MTVRSSSWFHSTTVLTKNEFRSCSVVASGTMYPPGVVGGITVDNVDGYVVTVALWLNFTFLSWLVVEECVWRHRWKQSFSNLEHDGKSCLASTSLLSTIIHTSLAFWHITGHHVAVATTSLTTEPCTVTISACPGERTRAQPLASVLTSII